MTVEHGPKTTSWAIIALTFVVWAATQALLFMSGPVRSLLGGLAQPTAGIVSAQLVANLITVAAVLAVVMRVGKLRRDDLGLRRGIVPGVAAAVALWLAWQLMLLAFGVFGGAGA